MNNSTQGAALEPLWDDHRIIEAAGIADGEFHAFHDTKNYSVATVCYRQLRKMRDEMAAALVDRDAKIAALEAQLAEARTQLSGTEAAWDEVESMMLGEDE